MQRDVPLGAALRNNNPLHQALVRTLGGGGAGISARWWKVAVELSKQPTLNKKIDLDWIQDIESNHPSGPTRATAFLSELAELKVSAVTFISALRGALLEVSADEVEAALRATQTYAAVSPQKQTSQPYLSPPAAAKQLPVVPADPAVVTSAASTVEWRLGWSPLCVELCQQLPVNALSVLQTAFNCHGATSIQHFFDIKNSTNFFTGPDARQNCSNLLSVLSPWRDVEAVQKLVTAVNTV